MEEGTYKHLQFYLFILWILFLMYDDNDVFLFALNW